MDFLKELQQISESNHVKMDVSFLDDLGDWIFAQYFARDLDEDLTNFEEGFYRAMDFADEEYIESIKRVYYDIKKSGKTHTVGDHYEFHDEFDEGDKIPLVTTKHLAEIYDSIIDLQGRFEERKHR